MLTEEQNNKIELLLKKLTAVADERKNSGDITKFMVTTICHVSPETNQFCEDLAYSLTTCDYVKHIGNSELKTLLTQARQKHYTHLAVVSEAGARAAGRRSVCTITFFDLYAGASLLFKVIFFEFATLSII